MSISLAVAAGFFGRQGRTTGEHYVIHAILEDSKFSVVFIRRPFRLICHKIAFHLRPSDISQIEYLSVVADTSSDDHFSLVVHFSSNATWGDDTGQSPHSIGDMIPTDAISAGKPLLGNIQLDFGPSTRKDILVSYQGFIQALQSICSQNEVPMIPQCSAFLNLNPAIFPIKTPYGLNGGAATVEATDFFRLKDTRFLNDLLIEIGIQYLVSSARENCQDASNIFVLSSFFFEKLRSVGVEGARSFTSSTKRLTSQATDIFCYKTILRRAKQHWWLLVIHNPAFFLEYPDENGVDSVCQDENRAVPDALRKSRTWIFTLDSLGGKHQDCLPLVTSWLADQAGIKRQKEGPFRVPMLRFLSTIQQNDSYNCGIFVLHFCRVLLNQTPIQFAEKGWDVQESREKEENNIFWNPSAVSSFRVELTLMLRSLGETHLDL
ncbi:hypothetical protein DL96DRAFT_1716997 [Flagelloscypha sp. PMI_526]|nr:hypothetical protein DL96DRAFT_1721726 [Flagelloscypha sp. PMI_526]KAH8810295.1 hypothetical protein DL96DRAFT_1716997 [Flagelloscypha sp. PMI_526]